MKEELKALMRQFIEESKEDRTVNVSRDVYKIDSPTFVHFLRWLEKV